MISSFAWRSEAGRLEVAPMSETFQKTKPAMIASRITGPAVQASSSFVWPRTCGPSTSRGRPLLR